MNRMKAYVTLVATDPYAAGALVIARRLRDLNSTIDIVCLVTPNISNTVRELLSDACIVIEVETIRSSDSFNLGVLGRPDLDITFTKIHCWRLTQYSKIVFLDADTYPLHNIDDLFDRPSFSAAPDAGWPDCFNSGVFVAEPSEKTYEELRELASHKGSFDGGDQGLLNTYFSSWSASPNQRLPFTYNTTPTSQYSYAPAYNAFGHNIAVMHFIGRNKPWKYQRFIDGKVLPNGNTWERIGTVIQKWWDTWDKYYGRTSPYQLLSGNNKSEYDSGFQTCPIVPFDRPIKNAWDDITVAEHHDRVNQMPPLEKITVGNPKWLFEEPPRTTQSVEHERQNQNISSEDEELVEIQERDEGRQKDSDNSDSEAQDHQDEQKTSPDENEPRESQPYNMIHWDPANESPPKTGCLTAAIPDLSQFKNVWDQPADEQQHIWIAPVYQPEPEIMTKPEYSHYITHDPHPSSNDNHSGESHWDLSGQPDKKEEGSPQYASCFPWENDTESKAQPTRIWRDEQFEGSISEDHASDQHESKSVDDHLGLNSELEPEQSSIHYDSPTQEPSTPQHNSPQHNSPQQDYEGLNSTYPDSAPDPPAHEGQNESQSYKNDDSSFAIDKTLKPSSQLHIHEFLSAESDDENEPHDVSERDLIPIVFKSSSRLNSGMYTPTSGGNRSARSPTPNRGSNGALNSPSGRRYSHSSNHAPAMVIPDYTGKQPTRLFATGVSSYSRKTPYTSAAVTPATGGSPEFGKQGYFDDEEYGQESFNLNEDKRPDFLKSSSYSLNECLVFERNFGDVDEWDPFTALDTLKSRSDSMVLRQSLQEALEKAVKEQEDKKEDMDDDKDFEASTAEVEAESFRKKPPKFDSAWSTQPLSLPSALASGQSTPRTPIIEYDKSELSKEIELEKERYRQQREALTLLQPQAAVASVFDAELELSQGAVGQFKFCENSIPSPELFQSSEVPIQSEDNQSGGDQSKNYLAYYNGSIITEAQKRLAALLLGNEPSDTEEDVYPVTLYASQTPLEEPEQPEISESFIQVQNESGFQQFGLDYNPSSYLPNFGFDEHNKLTIHHPELIEDTMANIQEDTDIKLVNEPLKDVKVIGTKEEHECHIEVPKVDPMKIISATYTEATDIESSTDFIYQKDKKLPVFVNNEEVQETNAHPLEKTGPASTSIANDVSEPPPSENTYDIQKKYKFVIHKHISVDSLDIPMDTDRSELTDKSNQSALCVDRAEMAAQCEHTGSEELDFTKPKLDDIQVTPVPKDTSTTQGTIMHAQSDNAMTNITDTTENMMKNESVTMLSGTETAIRGLDSELQSVSSKSTQAVKRGNKDMYSD